ncbi:hypothetical protein [uncultured Campylobacter sp.]|uniref:hypothetical protein n=1 Tax=uncultured Campylobacter sp. TaxID=218934 RepID=UPI002601FD9C|nr:hypothetical protein [uncultured Campylobacter sp.]
MQTSLHLLSLKRVFAIFLLIIYIQIAALTQLLPPLIGLFFTIFVFLTYESRRTFSNFKFSWYVAFFYLLFASTIKGFEPFALFINFIIFYIYIFTLMEHYIKINSLFIFIVVFYGYIGTFLINNALLYFANSSHFLHLSYEYFLFIVVEFLIAFIFFKDRALL